MNYEYTYDLKVRIYTADDVNDKFHASHLRISSTYPIAKGNPLNRHEGQGQILDIRLRRQYIKGEPMILSIKKELQRWLGWGARGYNHAPKEFSVKFQFPYCTNEDGVPATFIINKTNPYYNLMGNRMTKRNLMIALSRAVYRSCFEDDALVLTEYLFKMITLPENVSYALENRTPYWFYEEVSISTPFPKARRVILPEKIHIRLNTKMIGPEECALEISDGVWAPISVKDLDIFINYFYHEHSRAKKWAYKSPRKIWAILMGEEPSTSQEKLMKEFLTQNRTQELVETRAKELMAGLAVKYPDRIKSFPFENNTIMIIRGKLCDWVIIDSAYKTNIQKVKTYAFITHESAKKDGTKHYSRRHNILTQKNVFYNGNLRGPICIDNIHDNSSVGDQYAARALALLNDKATINLVYTIAKYIPDAVRGGSMESRFEDFDSLDENAPWSVIV